MNSDERAFPAVTLCNLCPYKSSGIASVDELEALVGSHKLQEHRVASVNSCAICRWSPSSTPSARQSPPIVKGGPAAHRRATVQDVPTGTRLPTHDVGSNVMINTI
jgi:hypothetical protein